MLTPAESMWVYKLALELTTGMMIMLVRHDGLINESIARSTTRTVKKYDNDMAQWGIVELSGVSYER